MEAHLLQVSLPEVHELYRTLLARPSPPPRTEQNSPARPSGEKASRGCRTGGVGTGSLAALVPILRLPSGRQVLGTSGRTAWLSVLFPQLLRLRCF